MYKYSAIFVISLVSALLCTPLVKRWAIRMGVMDQPEERRIHSAPVPRLGGVAVLITLLITFAASAIIDRFFVSVFFGYANRIAILLAASTIVVLFGALDDAFSLRPGLKLAAEAAAASILLFVGAGLNILGGIHLGIFGWPLTLLWLLAVTNAFNLIDGLDGLAAGIGTIVSATLFANCVYSGDIANAMMLVGLCGALLGFLRYNFYPAQIFLGDSGALLIGFILAFVSMDTGNRLSALVAIAVPMLALGLPLAETALTVIRRLLRVVRIVRYNRDRDRYEFLFVGSAALFTADREHIHHRLLDLGFSHRNAVLLLYGISLTFGAAAFGIVAYRQFNLALLLAAFGLVSILGIQRLNYSELQLIRKGVLLPLFDSRLASGKRLRMLADLGFIIVSYFAALMIGGGGSVNAEAKRTFFQAVPFFSITQLGALALCGLYRCSCRNGGIGDLLGSIKAVLIAVAVSWLAASLLDGWIYCSLNVAILDGYLLVTTVIGGRLSFRVLEYSFKAHTTGHRRALIYGIGNAGMSALHEIRNNPGLDLQVIGFLDDNGGSRRTLDGLPILGPQALENLIARRQVDEVILSVPSTSEAGLKHLREVCGNAGITLRRFSIGWQEVAPLITSVTNAQAAAD
jgi:UDP-GlcNAc:undecaprenyl-phosphate/decaprenyl-phosphate GlcNAc-1-phosphate transferase